MIHYGGRLFRPVATTGETQTSDATIFKYEQTGRIVIATYSGGDIAFGHLLGRVLEDDKLESRYHHLDRDGVLKTGECLTTPETLPSGKLRLHESWRWTCGDGSSGTSVLEEL